MENIIQTLPDTPYTILSDRVLWVDGESSFDVDQIRRMILESDSNWKESKVIDEDDFSVAKLRELTGITLREKDSLDFPENVYDWNIPERFKKFDVHLLVRELLKKELSGGDFTKEEMATRLKRTSMEMELWENNDLIPILRLLVYVIDTFNRENIVWGTGRGSSCCSYILYLIGVHDVDSVRYGLDIKDFFRS